ncbi:MAG TPA: hypothetical protein VFM24_09730 [Nitrospira sp.]|nr:hypothetical protein [Nitrospira sp.]
MPSILKFPCLVFTVIAFPIIGLAGELPTVSATNEPTVVAAGFGFQDESLSFITVKSYDAQTGRVLSADTYELDIKDDSPPSSRPHSRIFAGGVGAGNGSLSEFTLRVYDASNGRFLWEGRLNLTAGEHPEAATQRVVAHVRPRTAVVTVASRPKQIGQPHFVLRAVNPQTGQLVWSDEFSTEAPAARVEHISRSVIGMTGAAPRDIDFRIKMPDQGGRRWLWEDKIEPVDDGEASSAEESDEAPGGRLRRDPQATTPWAALPANAPSSVIGTARRTPTTAPGTRPAGFAFS